MNLTPTPQEIVTNCDAAIVKAQQLAESIRKLSDGLPEARTWDNTFGAFDTIATTLQESGRSAQLLMVAHPDAAIREAAMTCEPKIDAFASALYVDDGIAKTLRTFAEESSGHSAEHKHFIEDVLRDYKRNGLSLDAAGRETLRGINEKITALGQQFDKNLSEAQGVIEISAKQLDGLPPSFIDSHLPQDNGMIRITTDYPDLVPFMRYAKDRSAARELYKASQNRAVDKNLPLLDELIVLRAKKAALMGYTTWADYILEPRMAKTAGTVKTFLNDLHVAIKPKREEEFSILRDVALSLGHPANEPVPASDGAYLEDIVGKERYHLDTQRLSEYFEVQSVLKGILDISSKLYGISFHPTTETTWHPDVQTFDVKDSTGNTLGHAYLDLYPRDNKYKHAAVFPLDGTMKLPDGTRKQPSAALVCNFPQPGETVALLSHDDVTTFFHEFGHLLHHLLSQAELTSFGGTSVAWDFVEAPSQMFEEWAWKRETLNLFAKHHETGEKIPEDLFVAMTAARSFGEVTMVDRQIFLATLDQTYHTRTPGFNTTEVMEALHPEYSSFARIPGTHFQATFGHLVGYDAAYYGYQWAKSIACDLFQRFENEGMLNKKTAADYRKAVLEPGGSKDANELIKDFLGREPNAEAYKRFLGIV